jgi:PTS system mannitol-specific IIC component
MLVNNFSAGILAAIMAILGMFALAPVLREVISWLGEAVNFLVDNGLLPLTSLFIEPAKVMFLNNAINHGVLTPLGVEEAAEAGKSVLFLLEANPGPGLGLLLAYSFFGRGVAKATAPGAAIIQFFGGIHEVYFPFVLMKPKMILATIAGGMTGIFLFVAFDVGLRAPAAPGSIAAVYAQTPGGDFFGISAGVFGAALVSFLVAAVLLKTDRSEEGDLSAATDQMESMKGKKSIASSTLGTSAAAHQGPITSIVFACDAGMGSSAMGASVLRKKIHGAGFTDVTVVNKAISNLTDTFDLVVSHQDLTPRAQQQTASAVHVSVENFMNSPKYDEIVDLVRERNGAGGEAPGAVVSEGAGGRETPGTSEGAAGSAGSLLSPESVVLDASGDTRADAITRAGQLLVEAGAVDPSYVEAMHAREASVSTYMGNGLALPHGTNEAKPAIRRTAISFVRYSEGLDWKGKEVRFVVGVAAQGNDHLKLLARIAEVFLDADQVARLEAAGNPQQVMEVLGEVQPA